MRSNEIAIIGIAGRYPKSESPEELWDNIVHDVDLSSSAEERIDERYVNKYYEIDEIDKFDHEFFGYTHAEASITDPQHRVLLECVYRVLENAGYEKLPDHLRVGIFASSSMSSYLLNILMQTDLYKTGEINYPLLIGNDKDFVATKIAYKLNLTGPALNIQCGCSSALVATHYACQSLLNGESDINIVGAVSILAPQDQGYEYKEGGILSKDGVCRPFDQNATGTIKGNGCSVVALKRLADAIRDHDRIYAVIKGTAVNNDGAAKIGYTAPSVVGESAVITSALAFSGVSPHEIDYIETHGTGTKLGDPVEIQGLTKVFGHDDRKIPVGSIKADIGHLDVAAGLTSLIKAVLVIQNQYIPKIKNFSLENSIVSTIKHPFEFPTSAMQRKIENVSVSSFALGGTNCHAVISRDQGRETLKSKALPSYLVPIYLNQLQDCEQYRLNIIEKMDEELDFHDFACAMALAKKHRKYVAFISAKDKRDFISKIMALSLSDYSENKEAKVDFAALYGNMIWRRSALPHYPFNKKRCWIDNVEPVAQKNTSAMRVHDKKDILSDLIEIWEHKIGITQVEARTNFYAVGGDSLIAIDILNEVNTKFGVSLTMSEFNSRLNPEDFAALIENKLNTSPKEGMSAGCIHLLRKSASNKNIFLVHPAGGTTFCYSKLNQSLQGDFNLYSIDLPEHYSQLNSMRLLGQFYLDEIKKYQKEGPYIIGGYSFGGNLAYEMAVILQEQGERVEQVIMFDSHPPLAYTDYQEGSIRYNEVLPDILISYFNNAKIEPELKKSFMSKEMHEIISLMKDDKIIKTPLSTADLLIFFERWIFSHQLLKSHQIQGIVQSDLLIFVGTEVEDTGILKQLQIKQTSKDEWNRYFSGDVHQIKVEGNHYSMFGVDEFAKGLAESFDSHILKQSGANNV